MAFVVKIDNSKALEVIKDRRRIDLFALIATFMAIPLINVTKYMAVK